MSVAGYHAYGLRQRSGAIRSSRPQPLNYRSQDRGPRQSTLANIIENTVVPRLVAHLAPRATLDLEKDVAAFTKTLLDPDPSLAAAHFLALVDQGYAIDLLFDNLLAPAACRLGFMWDRDEADFLEVANAMHHIQRIILSQASTFYAAGPAEGIERNILLVTLPGEQHRLGLCLLRAHLWREGWSVDCHELKTMSELQRLVGNRLYDALGLSATRISDPAFTAHTLNGVRKASCNKDLVIMAGGRAFSADPSLAMAVGVDATAADGRECISILRRFFDQTAARPG